MGQHSDDGFFSETRLCCGQRKALNEQVGTWVEPMWEAKVGCEVMLPD